MAAGHAGGGPPPGAAAARRAPKSRVSTGRSRSTRARSGGCAREIAAYQARLEAVPGVESEWIALTRDYDTLQESYRQLLAKSENSKMAASLEQRAIGEQFRILDPARVPLKPHSPDRLRINLVGTLAGLGLGVLLLGFAHYRDSTMRSEADVLGAIELPVLALVPLVKTDADLSPREAEAPARRRRPSSRSASATGALFWYLQLWKFVL